MVTSQVHLLHVSFFPFYPGVINCDKYNRKTIRQKFTIGKPRETLAWKKESWASETCIFSNRDVGNTLEQTEQEAV